VIHKYPPITADTFAEHLLMRSWSADGFLVELYETGHTDFEHFGHTSVGYRLFDIDYSQMTGDGSPIFQGTDYGIPRGQCVDDDEAVRGIIGFLSLMHGDTDGEFFEDYTPRQIAWCEQRAEALGLWSLDDIDMTTGEYLGNDL
jgi:hypothetical protein